MVYTQVIDALTSGRVKMTYIGLILVLGGLLIVYRNWIKALVPIIPMFMVTGWSGLVMTYLKLDYTPMTATMNCGCEIIDRDFIKNSIKFLIFKS